MFPIIVLVLLCAGVGAGLWVLSNHQKGSTAQSAPEKELNAAQVFTYSCQKSLFTRAELSFYRALQTATVGQYQVLGKVRVADVLKPQTDNRSDWQRAFNKISAKHFDFVLCDSKSLKALAAVELDDSSHQRVDRVKRDDFLNQAMISAGLPLLRFPVQAIYDVKAIEDQIARNLGEPALDPDPIPKPRPTSKPQPRSTPSKKRPG